MSKSWSKIIFWICLTNLLTGCWDRQEFSKISVVTGMAVDKGKDFKYKLSIEITEARETNTKTAIGTAPAHVSSLEGNTVGELISKFNIVNATKPIYSHMRILVISEELARDGKLEFMDFFDRNRQMRDDFGIVIARAESGSAKDVLTVNNMDKKSASLKLSTQLNTMQKDWGGTPDVKLNDYTRIFNSGGQAPVLPAVIVVGDPKQGSKLENLKSVVPKSEVDVSSLAVLKKGKLAGYASLYDVRNMLFVQGKIKTTTISATCDNEKKKFAYRITQSKTKVTGREIDGIPNFNIQIKTEGILDEAECLMTLRDPDTFKTFENIINNMMEKQIKNLVIKTKEEYNADIFGLGDILREQDYKHFKKYKDTWDDGYAKAKIHVSFSSEIKSNGIRTDRYIMKRR